MQSHDNLVDDFVIEPFTVPVPGGAVHHGLNLEGLSSGNVWRRGRMSEGTFDTHRALPFENARTNITLVNNGRVGGSAASGPLFGARIAHWNVRITSGSPYALTIGRRGAAQPDRRRPGHRPARTASSPRDFSGDLENVLADHGRAPARHRPVRRPAGDQRQRVTIAAITRSFSSQSPACRAASLHGTFSHWTEPASRSTGNPTQSVRPSSAAPARPSMSRRVAQPGDHRGEDEAADDLERRTSRPAACRRRPG